MPPIARREPAHPRGSFVGVVGPNGSGKTTLLSMMNSQILPSRGHVIVDENDTAECRVRRMAREVAYLDCTRCI